MIQQMDEEMEAEESAQVEEEQNDDDLEEEDNFGIEEKELY